MKTYKKIILTLFILIGVNSYAQSDTETIRNLLRFTYFPEPTEDRRFPIVNTSVASGTETGRFWEDSGIDDLQNFIRAVLKDPSSGGDATLQHAIAEVLKLNNRKILVYLWKDANSITRSQYAHSLKPCVSDYDRSDSATDYHVWPCAAYISREDDPNWGGYVHIGQHYATAKGYDKLKATFIHEFMHTQDPVSALNDRFTVMNHLYRYGHDGTHFDVEAVPNKRQAYKEGIANVLSILFDNNDLQRYLRWFANNGSIMVEREVPHGFFRVFRGIMGYSDDVWLYNQISAVHGAGVQHGSHPEYSTYPVRNLNPEFIVHNEVVTAMALGLTSLHVRDIDPFIWAVKKVNTQIRGNQEQDPFALIVNKFALGLTSRGDSLAEIQNQLESSGVQDQPYYPILPLAYFDFFTGYGASSKSEFNAMFSGELNTTLLDIYWDYFKDRVRTVPIPPIPNSSGSSRSGQSRIWDNISDVSIQCGVNQSLLPGVQDFNFEPSGSSNSNTPQATDDLDESSRAASSEDGDEGTSQASTQADGDCRDWPSFGTESSVTANGVSVPVFNATEAQKSNLEQTLSRLPVAHINAIPQIIIVSDDGPNYFLSHPERGGASWRCSPANRANEWIKISAYSLTERRNQKINFTLLHEIGHFIDRDFNIVSAHQEEARRYLRETDYQGHTQGAGEAIAQGYMYYFASTTATERNPRVRDRLPVYLKEILENSSAWANVSTW
ncbi:hypothetical protein [Maribacter sp. MAR_2009_72]|uniref:hypothetical protein n=1 Tax=Maribacter sp. MAR_2009_72 TaxID=1250050 RepID=UPI00119B0F44|nr:hypothetical protein [Maribacter sp. MAR_2009_72]TVZ14874.1 hypothetical protein JM81_1087 [Maribacter sp. MAR_2009_72]